MIDSWEGVLLEATRLFDLHPGVGVVGGNVLDPDHNIVDGCYLTNPSGVLESPWLGRSATDGGPFALALKPQSATLPGAALAFFRIAALKQAGLLPLDKQWSGDAVIWRLCDRLAPLDWSVVFSPQSARKSGPAAGADRFRECRRPRSQRQAKRSPADGIARNFVSG